jgi:hypothetical protein
MSFITKLIQYCIKPKPLDISMFNEIRIVRDDKWNKVTDGEISLCYFDKSYDTSLLDITNVDETQFKSVAYINYRIGTGQIGLFFINKHDYQNRGLGKQILLSVINEMRLNNRKSVWAITSYEHPFWSNVFNKSFIKSKRPHLSVTGSGYVMRL